MAERTCANATCSNPVEGRRKYCSDQCRHGQYQRKRRKAEQAGRQLALEEKLTHRRGRVYAAIESLELYEAWAKGKHSYEDVRKQLAEHGITVTQEAVIISLQAMDTDAKLKEISATWEMDPEIRAMLALDAPDESDADFEAWLDEAVEQFTRFRARFFRMSKGPYLTKPFHKRWIKEILRAIFTGGQLQIMAPPRHGKSELLGHFCVWLICRNPNIRILWVSGNSEIAGDMSGAVRDHLMDNRDLIRAVLPPGAMFQPTRASSKPWKATRFTVATSNIIGQKSATFTSLGRGGKILSRDVDIIVADDIEDHDSTEQEGRRSSTRRWFFTTLSSRKEEHTAWVTIGSRQHHDDLYGYLEDDDEWESITDAAHNPQCELDPEKVSLHVDCMLFPEVRSYRWLRSKWRSAFNMNQEDLFEMVYQNVTTEAGDMFWTRQLCENAYNPNRAIGEKPKDAPIYLVAGLDPSVTGHQASYLNGMEMYVEQPRQYMIDMDNRLGGGSGPAAEIMESWAVKYGARHWVVEANLYRGGIVNSAEVREVQQKYNLILEPHETQGNKYDPYFGVGAMRKLYEIPEDGSRSHCLADLPTKGGASQQQIEVLVRQMVNFSSNATIQRRRKSDVLMAKWFTQKVIRRLISEYLAAIEDQERADAHIDSFSGYESSEYGEAPW